MVVRKADESTKRNEKKLAKTGRQWKKIKKIIGRQNIKQK